MAGLCRTKRAGCCREQLISELPKLRCFRLVHTEQRSGKLPDTKDAIGTRVFHQSLKSGSKCVGDRITKGLVRLCLDGDQEGAVFILRIDNQITIAWLAGKAIKGKFHLGLAIPVPHYAKGWVGR